MANEFEDPELEEREDAQDDEFARLLDQHLPGAAPRALGELVDGTVVAVLSDSVLVSYGQKEECPIPIAEFQDARGAVSVRPGDTVRVVLKGWDDEGAQLSYREARRLEAQQALEEASRHGKPIRGTVSREVKGGLVVDVGMPAFLPGSQVDLFRVPDLSALVGQEIEAYVIELDPERGRAVLSRRKLLEERKEKSRHEFLSQVQPGSVVTGRVRDVLDFGAFIVIDGVEGLIPRSEITYERGQHPSDVLKPGQDVQVKVLDVDAASGKLTLSRKRLGEDPWESVADRYPAGSSVTGTVLRVESFGAFVQLEEGLTGLLHSKDLSWDSESKDAREKFIIGDSVSCQVVEIDQANRRLSLSLKHLSRDPWMDVEASFPVGAKVKGVISKLRDFGAFVKLNEFVEGLLHIGDLSWETRPNHPSEVVKEGDEIEVMVLKLDREQRRIGLGLKQLQSSPFSDFMKEHQVGSVVTAKVSRLMPFGAFVELGRGLEGLIHISELSEERVDSVERAVRLGEEVTVKVLAIDPAKGRIGLSRRAAIKAQEEDNIRSWKQTEKRKEEEVISPFAAALKSAMNKKK